MAKPRLGDSPAFNQEWISVGDHRILVEDDPGPPRTILRRVAMLAAWRLESIPNYDPIRIVKIKGCKDGFAVTMAVSKSHRDVAQIAGIDVSESIEGFYTTYSVSAECLVSGSEGDPEDLGYTESLTRFVLEK
jgi:hypothetical protein